MEREDKDEDVIGEALNVSVKWVERVRCERSGDCKTSMSTLFPIIERLDQLTNEAMMRLVKILV